MKNLFTALRAENTKSGKEVSDSIPAKYSMGL
jgi:hypothetical protein